MQIGTGYFFDSRNRQMTGLSNAAAKLQEQISTGKRITTPSDDPIASARLSRLNTQDSDNAQYATNVKLAQSLLGQSETALTAITNQLQRAQELAIQAGSDTLNDGNRAAIGAELTAILDDLMRIANETDVRGTALFGGAGAGAAYVRSSNGAITYAGEGEAPQIPIGPGIAVQATDTGQRLFGGIKAGGSTKDMFAILGDVAGALQPGLSPAARKQALDDATDGLANAASRVGSAITSIGARGTRLDFESERLTRAATENEIARGDLEGADIQASVTELQKTMLALQATQASFSKLSQLSLFDYLR